jgi:glutamyl-tRNA synthetase
MTAIDHASAVPVVGRFAPSPSGAMHLGNARTALLAWLDTRARGGSMVLRIEDLDRDRCRSEFAQLARQDLAWLGLDWDRETLPQSSREPDHRAAVARLEADGLLYPCFCSRRELTAASAPHGGERAYPGTCRGLTDAQRERLSFDGRTGALRVAMPDRLPAVGDRLVDGGPPRPGNGGDVVVRRSDGLHAYQLAVVVDDARDGVTDVVRGDDLRASTGWQVALQQMLGLPTPRYAHVPLVVGPDGERLAKRHGGVSLAEMRARGVRPERLVGLLAQLSGLGEGQPAMPDQLVAGFRLEDIPREPMLLDVSAIVQRC